MTIAEAKATIYANVVYACEKAGFAPQTTWLVQDACDTIIALAERKTEPSDSEKPNNCETCKWWFGYCHLEECEYEPKTKRYAECYDGCNWPIGSPQCEGCEILPKTEWYEKCVKTEPQTDPKTNAERCPYCGVGIIVKGINNCSWCGKSITDEPQARLCRECEAEPETEKKFPRSTEKPIQITWVDEDLNALGKTKS